MAKKSSNPTVQSSTEQTLIANPSATPASEVTKVTRTRKPHNTYTLLYQPSVSAQLIVFFMHNSDLEEVAIYDKKTGMLVPFAGEPSMFKAFKQMVVSRDSTAIELCKTEVNPELSDKMNLHLVSFFVPFGHFISNTEREVISAENEVTPIVTE